jgi:hypothetical protein
MKQPLSESEQFEADQLDREREAILRAGSPVPRWFPTPREPTQEMLQIGRDAYITRNEAPDRSVEGAVARIWRAMWDAAKDAS